MSRMRENHIAAGRAKDGKNGGQQGTNSGGSGTSSGTSHQSQIKTQLHQHFRAFPHWVYKVPVISTVAKFPVVDQIFRSYATLGTILLLLEVILNYAIIAKVKYTEIDWQAYMSEVKPVVQNGDFNYSKLKGGTGPLVYPGGFVWLYALLYKVCGEGQNIKAAQYIFMLFYLITLAVIFAIYSAAASVVSSDSGSTSTSSNSHDKTGNDADGRGSQVRSGGNFLGMLATDTSGKELGFMRPMYLVTLCLSKRIHSIFTLRLFNDGPAMLLVYLSILCLLYHKKAMACVFYSLGVSVKMNIFLFAPGLFLVLLSDGGIRSAAFHIGICALVQLIVGFPFLVSYPFEYITQSFNLARTFNHYWSVNFKWVPCQPLPSDQKTLLNDCEGIFTSKIFGIGLLVVTIALWVYFAAACGGPKSSTSFLKKALQGSSPFSNAEIVSVMLSSNFIGVILSKSLHFQFYVWYFHALPYLLWCTRYSVPVKLLLLLGVEFCWNPWSGDTSSIESSFMLTLLHFVMLLGLFDGLKVRKPKDD